MLEMLNKVLLKFMPIMTPTSVIIGILFTETFKPYAFLVPWLFAFMTFSGSLNSKFADIKTVIKYPRPLFICLAVLHLIMPLFAFGVGHVAFPEDPNTIIGLVLAFLIPTGVSSLVWVTIYKGNVILTLAIILIDSLIKPFVVPTILHLFLATTVHMKGMEIMQGLIWMIVLPSIAGMLLNEATKGKINKVLKPKLEPFSKICLGLVVGLNGAVIAPYFKEINAKLLFITAIVFIVACSGYIISGFIAKIFNEETDIQIALIYNGGMRNISAGAVIAITYFPAAVAVPVIIGMLFQQILASFTGTVLSRRVKNYTSFGNF